MSAPRGSVGRSRARVRHALTGAVAVSAVVLDQVTKSLAVAALKDGPIPLVWTLRLRLTFNTGAAFSLGQGRAAVFVALGIVLVATLLAVVRTASATAAIGLGLVVGGAAGNLSDRIFRGHGGAVIDFIDLQWWPVFNVADSCIFVGVAVLILTWRPPTTEIEDEH